MCGIVGFSGNFDPGLLCRANACQRHRGPDDVGEFADERNGVGLGSVRLAIQDLSPLGHQPMISDDGSCVLAFNGEIYNFRELRAELEVDGHRFRGHSDTEVVLRLYQVHGASMLSRLNGIFALAIWDNRDRSVLVARDALGVKPLYYTECAQGFAFASEMKALLNLVPVARDLDHAALHRYMSFLWCPGDGTPFKAVRKVSPGEALLVREGRAVRRWNWYELPVFRGIVPDAGENGATAGAVDHIRRAVHRQLVADVPVGAFLSGGLDSSAVVAFAREESPGIRCFTIESAGGEAEGVANDLPYARRVASHLGVPLDVVHIDADRMASDLAGMVAQLDEPLADPAPLNVLYISRLARDHGIKVLLSGAGGDDLFTGYRRHVALRYENYWRWLPRPLLSGLEAASEKLDQRHTLFRRVAKLLDGAALTGDARIAGKFVWAKESRLLGLYSPEFRRRLRGATATAPMIDFLRPLPASVGAIDRALALEQRFFLPDHNLTYTDKMSMAVGVEVRVPFLDLELVEFAARVPATLKQRGATGKWILKRAMLGLLPDDVIHRPKSGFGAPLRRWMRNDLRPMLSDVLSSDSVRRRGLFDPGAVQRLIAANDTGEADAAYTLLSLLTIELWCRAYADAAGAGG